MNMQFAIAYSWPMPNARALIAVVDDEAAVRKAIARLISFAGYEVVTYGDGAQFMQSLALRRPQCVLLDLHMPVMGGAEVQARLAACGDPLPVIVITGQDSDQTRDRVLACGTSAFLRKPVDEQVLLDAIAVALSKGVGDPC